MWIDPENRCVRLSVGELANFRNQPDTSRVGYNRWRAEVGQQWHRIAEEQARTKFPSAEFERTVQAQWLYEGWTLKIQGRVDQILPAPGGIRIIEVKTIRDTVPIREEELATRYPEYFAQTAIYLSILKKLPAFKTGKITAEIHFIEIDSGTVQRVLLEESDEARFETQLLKLLPYLEDRRSCRINFKQSDLRPPFEELREGQQEAANDLEAAALQAKTVLFEAPTGFGKTGILLGHTLQLMQAGHFDRCIYLTSKSTGQLETVRQLQDMTGGSLRFLQMRSRIEHQIDNLRHRCSGGRTCDDALTSQYTEEEVFPGGLFQAGTFPLERAKELGNETGICPYALTRSCLPYADLWIADYNYVFNPDSRHIFFDCPGFDPKKTCLIIDEAHNLPSRVSDALGVKIRSHELSFAAEELRSAGAPRRLVRQYQIFAEQIDRSSDGQALSDQQFYEVLDNAEEITRELKTAGFNSTEILPSVLDIIWSIPRLLDAMNCRTADWLFWAPSAGTMAASCLNSGPWIDRCLNPFATRYLMSGTLEPVGSTMTECLLDPKSTAMVFGHAKWRDEAYDLAIDTRVDTRLKSRPRHYKTTAETIAAAIQSSGGTPVAVFFSSYQYAVNVKEYLSVLHPMVRAIIQPRSGDLSERSAFISDGLNNADTLFLILGSSYSEGINQLGGHIKIAIVVGPALAELNLIQRTKLQRSDATTKALAFESVCILPAMRRLHQALGRLIRTPGQKTKVLLHGKRFDEREYFENLRPEYKSSLRINNTASLNLWLSR